MQQNIHVLARAVILKNNHILLVYDPSLSSFSYYYLPGGHIELHETATQALIREIKEETGYTGTIERFMGALEYGWSASEDGSCCHSHELNLIFKADIEGIDASSNMEQKEPHVAFKWMDVAKLHTINLLPPALGKCIPEWLKLNMHNAFASALKVHKIAKN